MHEHCDFLVSEQTNDFDFGRIRWQNWKTVPKVIILEQKKL